MDGVHTFDEHLKDQTNSPRNKATLEFFVIVSQELTSGIVLRVQIWSGSGNRRFTSARITSKILLWTGAVSWSLCRKECRKEYLFLHSIYTKYLVIGSKWPFDFVSLHFIPCARVEGQLEYPSNFVTFECGLFKRSASKSIHSGFEYQCRHHQN